MASNKISMRTALGRYHRAFGIWHRVAPQMLPSIVCAQLASKAAPLAGVYMSGLILNALTTKAASGTVWRLVMIALAVAACLTAASAVLNHWKETQQDCLYVLLEKILGDKRAGMDYPDADSQRVSDLEDQIRQNANFAGWGLGRIVFDFPDFCTALSSLLLGGIMGARLFMMPVSQEEMRFLNSPLLALVLLGTMAGAAIISAKLNAIAESHWASYASNGRLGNRFFSTYGYFADDGKRALDIRIYRQEKLTQYYGSKLNAFNEESAISKYLQGRGGLLLVTGQCVQVLMMGIIYLFVCMKTMAGAFPIGSATVYIGAVTEVFLGISGMLACIGDVQANAVFLQDTYDFLDTPNAMYQGSLTTEKRADRKYEVEFRDVSFRYPGAEAYALRHVSLKFRVGSRLAVVGMNGSGKTTFIKLLCRLYDPTEGQILLNGIDIRKYRYHEYMDIFSIVFQDFQLFAMPLGENVATGASYDRERAAHCLKQAGFGERMKTMSLDTHLYKNLDKQGVEISGGEAQKIAIARALYKDAPFIILDEPTAALDPVAEAEIYEKFDQIAGDKTAIYISHRLSSCKFCDEIVVFDNGRIIQQGTHQQLLEDKGGKYCALWDAQAQYYAKEPPENDPMARK